MAIALQEKKYGPNLLDFILTCESNYARLLKLLPMLDRTNVAFSYQDEKHIGCQLLVSLIEDAKFTTTVMLTQQTLSANVLPQPVMLVRLYHDARMAEVLSFQHQRAMQPRYPYPNPRMYHRNEKEQLNKFLGEWLRHNLKKVTA